MYARNTTTAIIKKFITFEIRSPYEKVELPTVNCTLLRSPTLGVNNPTNGVIISFTNALISLEAACPITNAISRPITENFYKNSTNS